MNDASSNRIDKLEYLSVASRYKISRINQNDHNVYVVKDDPYDLEARYDTSTNEWNYYSSNLMRIASSDMNISRIDLEALHDLINFTRSL